MKTYLECIPCFLRQAIECARLAGLNEEDQKRVIDRVAEQIPKFPLSSSPPEMAQEIHRIVRDVAGSKDPYRAVKEICNQKAAVVYEGLKDIIKKSDDPLYAALTYAIAGNIIDYGIKGAIDVSEELSAIIALLNETIAGQEERIFNYRAFRETLEKSTTILYLGDNAGETFFDRLLIEELLKISEGRKITFAVRGGAVINDALREDADIAGISGIVPVIDNGSDAPGTILEDCSENFVKIFNDADMIISKGQGNFESLSGAGRDIFFLFMAKCEIVTRDMDCSLKDVILFNHAPALRV